jgi:hypothetical protein
VPPVFVDGFRMLSDAVLYAEPGSARSTTGEPDECDPGLALRAAFVLLVELSPVASTATTMTAASAAQPATRATPCLRDGRMIYRTPMFTKS